MFHRQPRFAPPCNVTCDCDMSKFAPICGHNDMIYYSPCHAGCSAASILDNNTTFSNCECIPDLCESATFYTIPHLFCFFFLNANRFCSPLACTVNGSQEADARTGYCDGNCQSFLLFILLFSFFVFVHSTSEVGSILLIMRCTDPKGKNDVFFL